MGILLGEFNPHEPCFKLKRKKEKECSRSVSDSEALGELGAKLVFGHRKEFSKPQGESLGPLA